MHWQTPPYMKRWLEGQLGRSARTRFAAQAELIEPIELVLGGFSCTRHPWVVLSAGHAQPRGLSAAFA